MLPSRSVMAVTSPQLIVAVGFRTMNGSHLICFNGWRAAVLSLGRRHFGGLEKIKDGSYRDSRDDDCAYGTVMSRRGSRSKTKKRRIETKRFRRALKRGGAADPKYVRYRVPEKW
jgi:hypothetical protein